MAENILSISLQLFSSGKQKIRWRRKGRQHKQGEKERKGTRFTSFSLFLSLSLFSPHQGREEKRKGKGKEIIDNGEERREGLQREC